MADAPSLLLDQLVEVVGADVDALMTDLEAGDLTATAWRDATARVLARGHLAGFMAGAGTSELSPTDQKRVLKDLTVQLSFLDKFSIEVQEAAEFQKGWNARARMYSEAVGASVYAGAFRMWALPALPRDGSTQCLSRCNCSWDVQELKGEGNADAYWRLGPSESCQTCLERAEQWAPLKFRDGELQ